MYVCLSVCLSVSRTTPKIVEKNHEIFWEGYALRQGMVALLDGDVDSKPRIEASLFLKLAYGCP